MTSSRHRTKLKNKLLPWRQAPSTPTTLNRKQLLALEKVGRTGLLRRQEPEEVAPTVTARASASPRRTKLPSLVRPPAASIVRHQTRASEAMPPRRAQRPRTPSLPDSDTESELSLGGTSLAKFGKWRRCTTTPSRRKRRPRTPPSLAPTTSMKGFHPQPRNPPQIGADSTVSQGLDQRPPHHRERRQNPPNATRQTTNEHRPGRRNRPMHQIRRRHPGHTISGTGQQGQAHQA